MGEAIINNLGGIFTGAAMFLTALGTFINIMFTLRNRDQIKAIHREVENGAKDTQKALADIAKAAVAATSNRSVRATDVRPEP